MGNSHCPPLLLCEPFEIELLTPWILEAWMPRIITQMEIHGPSMVRGVWFGLLQGWSESTLL